MTNPLITSAKKMLMVLDDHIKVLERKDRVLRDEFVSIPSQNQHYFCVSDTNGTIQLFQDAAYVVEQILVISQGSFDTTFYQLSIQDTGASRNITLANRPLTNNTTQTNVVPSLAVPPEMFVPLHGVTNEYNGISPNVDYWLDLPVEWLLPRGGVLRMLLNPTPAATTAVGDSSHFPQVVLSGYKVY